MLETLIAVVAGLVLVALARRADARLPRAERLPMQWSFSGAVNWTAPRRVALGFIPALGVAILTAVAVCLRLFEPREGQEGWDTPVMLALALALVGSYLLHLKLIAWTLRR